MKFEFLKEKELELINNRFAEEDSIDYDNWDLMTDEEVLITDAGMFVNEAYCENKFNSLEEFAKNASEGEGHTVENTIKRLEEMLNKGILSIKY
jgi:3-phosphoglycerate kinase